MAAVGGRFTLERDLFRVALPVANQVRRFVAARGFAGRARLAVAVGTACVREETSDQVQPVEGARWSPPMNGVCIRRSLPRTLFAVAAC